MEDYENALSAFEKAISLDGNEIMPIYNAGLVHSFRGDTDQALAYFCRADEKEDIFEVALHAGRLLLDMEMPDRARPYLEKAVRLNPAHGSAYRTLGECREKTGDPDAALDAYKQAVKKNPNDAAALSAMGMLFDHLGESLEIATLFCRQSVEICPEIGLYRRRLGEILTRQDQFEAALDQFREASARGEDCRSLIDRIEAKLKN
jgi:tetratricopeptide (TPR) repeat protein